MSDKLNVLIVHNYYQIPGGEDTVVSNEMRMLSRYGHNIVLYTRNNSELKEMNLLQKVKIPFDTIFSVKSYNDIKRIIRENKIDIVHVHNTLNLISPSVYYAARRCGVPVIQTIHNFRLLCPGATLYRDGGICEDCLNKGLICSVKHSCYRNSKIQTLLCAITTYIHRLSGIYGKINYICLTEFNKEKLCNLKMISKDSVYVKPNFVSNSAYFVPEVLRKNQYVFAGRLDSLKGIDILLRAWTLVPDKTAKLLICGTGPLEKWCKQFIKEKHINAEMVGFLSNGEVRQIISESKALILPTKWYEGFPMSIVEAYSVGTPVICSDIGNSASVVDEGITGLKFKLNDENSIVEAIKRCYGMCESTLNVYKEKYTEEINYIKLIAAYEKSLNLK